MRSRGHRVKHDTRMLDWPQRPVGAVNVLILAAQVFALVPIASLGSDCARLFDGESRTQRVWFTLRLRAMDRQQ